MVAAYLDDVVIAGDSAINTVLEALHILHAAAPGFGLHLNLEKCELIPTAAGVGETSLGAFPASLKRRLDGNFLLLGAPIGSAHYCTQYLRDKRVAQVRESLQELSALEDSHAAFKILPACLGSCRLMHAMRTSRADWVEEVFQEWDGLLTIS